MTLKSYLEQKNKNKYVVSELCVLYNDFHKNFMWEQHSYPRILVNNVKRLKLIK